MSGSGSNYDKIKSSEKVLIRSLSRKHDDISQLMIYRSLCICICSKITSFFPNFTVSSGME